MDNFLPTEYKLPQNESRYTKLVKGENILRILTSPIVGWLDWKDKKPYRFRANNKPAQSMEVDGKIKHFWAMIVWNYQTKAIEVFEITQASIQKAIKSLADDPDWGTPLNYDIRITREGEGLDTEYSINPKPKTETSLEIKTCLLSKPIHLEALFDGGNPFEVTNSDEIDVSKIPFN